jgi:polyisoprenoid-binding protein YceI
MKGVTKEITLKFNYEGSAEQDWEGRKLSIAGFEGETIIDRTAFGIGEPGFIANDVKIEITLEAAQEKK